MGKLEKVGAAVVGVLLCIIVAVGVLNHGKTPKENGMTEADLEAKRQETALRNDAKNSKRGNTNTPKKKKNNNVVDLDDLDRRRAEAKKKRDAAAKKKREIAEAEKEAEAKKNAAKSGGDVAKSGKTASDPKNTKTTPKGDWPKMYTVQDRDVLGSICVKFYKTSRMVDTVRAANPGLNERRLIPGKTVIKLPAPDESIVAGKSTGTQRAKLVSKPRRPGFISTSYIQRHTGGKAGADKTAEKGYYIVRKNDSLSKIAQQQLGSAKHAEAIFQANKGLMKNRDRLVVGWKLKLPNVN